MDGKVFFRTFMVVIDPSTQRFQPWRFLLRWACWWSDSVEIYRPPCDVFRPLWKRPAAIRRVLDVAAVLPAVRLAATAWLLRLVESMVVIPAVRQTAAGRGGLAAGTGGDPFGFWP